VALADALGNLVRSFYFQASVTTASVSSRRLQALEAQVIDKALDNNAIRTELGERAAFAVIPSQAYRKPQASRDTEMYKWGHLIEKCFQRLKEFRRIAPATARPMRASRRPPSRRSLACAAMNVYSPLLLWRRSHLVHTEFGAEIL
jgi:hypothetical protein